MADPQTGSGNPFRHVPLAVTISVGAARTNVGELLELGEGSVLALDRKVEDDVDLMVGNRLIARGRLEQIDGDAGPALVVRLTEIVHEGL